MKWSTSRLVYEITGRTVYIDTKGRFFVDLRHNIKIFLAKNHILLAEKLKMQNCKIIFSKNSKLY